MNKGMRIKIQALIVCCINMTAFPMQQQEGSFFAMLSGLVVKTLGVIGGSHAIWKLTKKYSKQIQQDDTAEFEVEIENEVPVNSDQDSDSNKIDFVALLTSLQQDTRALSDKISGYEQTKMIVQNNSLQLEVVLQKYNQLDQQMLNIQQEYKQSANQGSQISDIKTLTNELQRALREQAESLSQHKQQVVLFDNWKQSIETKMGRHDLLAANLQNVEALLQATDIKYTQLQQDYKQIEELISRLERSHLSVNANASVIDLSRSLLVPHQSSTVGDHGNQSFFAESVQSQHHKESSSEFLDQSSHGCVIQREHEGSMPKVNSQHFVDDDSQE